MTRYYYTDPLAAAWMAKHFGMKFASENGAVAGITREGFTEFTKGGDNWLLLDRVYINADSLHLLEPQVGDVIMGANYAMLVTHTEDGQYHGSLGGTPFTAIKGFHIIRRKGIPFMWPEKEAA